MAYRSLYHPVLRAIRKQRGRSHITVESILAELGESSFGWSILVFSFINLIPLPTGSTLVTALPLIVASAQMCLGLPHVRLPNVVRQWRLPRAKARKAALRMARLTRPLEKLIRPRSQWFFQHRYKRVIGLLLLSFSLSLFVPVPLSGGIPATALLICAAGLIKQDGLALGLGIGVGVLSVLITSAMLTLIFFGIHNGGRLLDLP